jgi:hypothetical protein
LYKGHSKRKCDSSSTFDKLQYRQTLVHKSRRTAEESRTRLVSGKLTTFYKIKECFIRSEPYLSVLNSDQRNLITKFRISEHQLRIETGPYKRMKNQAGKISIL